MSRIRTIKPDYFKSEKIGDLSRDMRLMFIGLWTQADLNGVFEWRQRTLKLELFPWDADITHERIDAMLRGLMCAGVIRTFMHDGKQYGVIHDWEHHQHISGNEIDQRKKAVKNKRPVLPIPPKPVPGQDPIALICHQDQTGTVLGLDWDRTDPPGVRRKEEGVKEDGGGRGAEDPTTAADEYHPHDSEALIREAPTAEPKHLTTVIVQRIDAVDGSAVKTAAKAGDVVALVDAFGGNVEGKRPGEWRRETDGLSILHVLAILAEARFQRKHLREPSGMRAARQSWAKEITQQQARELCALYGLKPPGPIPVAVPEEASP